MTGMTLLRFDDAATPHDRALSLRHASAQPGVILPSEEEQQ
jgi:hypothetical protein